MKVIQDNKTSNGNIQNQQISLSCFDYKRFVLNDGIHTFAYFHKNFKKQILTDYHKKEEIQKDSHKKIIKISAYKQILDRWSDRGTRKQYCKIRLSRQIQACLFIYLFFLTKRFCAHKNTSQAKIR